MLLFNLLLLYSVLYRIGSLEKILVRLPCKTFVLYRIGSLETTRDKVLPNSEVLYRIGSLERKQNILSIR